MCGFIVSQGEYNNEKIQRRGPDKTTVLERNGHKFVHNLLAITGYAPQPYEDDDIVAVFNGEIYNHPYENSDGENIIPLYQKHGVDFPKYLDGEFAIALYDFNAGRAIFTTDIFATKPLWLSDDGVASYQSGIGGVKIPANTTVVKNIKNGEEITHSVHDFDFTQHKNTYDDWIDAFERAVAKRATDDCFMGLSSGYDSGAIALAMERNKAKFKAYSIVAEEDRETIEKRHERLTAGQILPLTGREYQETQVEIKNIAEEFAYRIKLDNGVRKSKMTDDKGAVGLAWICKNAPERVYISGQGSDEIISDYSAYPRQSTFKGHFPEKLEEWENFYSSCQEAYIAKEEHIAGAYGKEARYPFLDREVVQEFLWLKPELKNKHYKAPIHEYLTRYNYPFNEGQKVGFRADKNLL